MEAHVFVSINPNHISFRAQLQLRDVGLVLSPVGPSQNSPQLCHHPQVQHQRTSDIYLPIPWISHILSSPEKIYLVEVEDVVFKKQIIKSCKFPVSPT